MAPCLLPGVNLLLPTKAQIYSVLSCHNIPTNSLSLISLITEMGYPGVNLRSNHTITLEATQLIVFAACPALLLSEHWHRQDVVQSIGALLLTWPGSWSSCSSCEQRAQAGFQDDEKSQGCSPIKEELRPHRDHQLCTQHHAWPETARLLSANTQSSATAARTSPSNYQTVPLPALKNTHKQFAL